MSLIDTLIAGAHKRQQDAQTKALNKRGKQVRRILGNDLYDALAIHHNEYEGVLEFTVRGVTFFITGVMGSLGFTLSVGADYHRPFGRGCHVSDADDLLLFIDNHTRKEQA